MNFVFFSVSENGENGLGDEGADAGSAPENFWTRTAPHQQTDKTKKLHAPLFYILITFVLVLMQFGSTLFSSHSILVRQLVYFYS